MNIIDIAIAKALGGGGSGGTTDYSQMSNKPKINNVELSGNKSLADLGINAGSIGFDETETYTDGSVGAELSDQKNAIDQKITSPSSPTTGAFLVWNGTAWVAQTLATWQGGNY